MFLETPKWRKYVYMYVLQDLKGTLEQELDFINEGRNSEHCSRDLSKFSFIYVPQVLWNLSTKVLYIFYTFMILQFTVIN
jgi:aarF domain-containing kinase